MTGGAAAKDVETRKEQMGIIAMNSVLKPTDPKTHLILGGDFNNELKDVIVLIKENSLPFTSLEECFPTYNSENRVQKRERDGWSGV